MAGERQGKVCGVDDAAYGVPPGDASRNNAGEGLRRGLHTCCRGPKLIQITVIPAAKEPLWFG